MPTLFLFAYAHQVAEEVVILRPVHQADISHISFWREIVPTDEPTVPPQIERSSCLSHRIESQGSRLKRGRMRIGKVQQLARPGRSQLWHERAPEVVLAGFFNDMFPDRIVIDGE